MRSKTLRRWWLAPVAATALLLGLTSQATGRPGDVAQAPFAAARAKAHRAPPRSPPATTAAASPWSPTT